MTPQEPIRCDMRTASDTPRERAAEYQRLFATALCGRDRTKRMVRFRFRLSAVDEEQVRRLADKERACCPFFDIRLTKREDELWWETRVDDIPDAVAMLEEFAHLPDQHIAAGTQADDMIQHGLITAGPHR